MHSRRFAIFVVPLVAALAFSISAHAQEFFSIRSGADASKVFIVTSDVIAKAGMTSAKTALPGTEGNVHEVRGPLMKDLLAQAGITGETVTAIALDSYEIDIPTADFEQFGVIAVTEIDGKQIGVRDKGPAWIVYPAADNPALKDPVYEARSVWQLKELVVK